jgi:hypothetical protein
MNARHLLWQISQTPIAPSTDPDPLREDDALQEAQLVAVHIDAVRSRGALLFDLRNALQLRSGNAAVLVLRGIRVFRWSCAFRPSDRTAWNVVSSEPRTEGGIFELQLAFVPNAELHIDVDTSGHFYELLMTALPDKPPDYTIDDDPTIDAGIPQWDTTLEVISASNLTL